MNHRDKEGIARTVKALSIVDKIQEFCEDNDCNFEEFLPIVRNPLRPENVAALGKFCTHCRGWPSRSTWYYVEVILKSFEVRDIRVHNKGEELDELPSDRQVPQYPDRVQPDQGQETVR